MTRPASTECSPYYAGYIARVPDGDVVATLRAQVGETMGVVRALAEDMGGHRYAPDKWSIRQVLGHLADTERIMAYRGLRAARGDLVSSPDESLHAF